MTTLNNQLSINKYWAYALCLAVFTIFYNLLEGLISISFGISNEALTLFGVDSFIELTGFGFVDSLGAAVTDDTHRIYTCH